MSTAVYEIPVRSISGEEELIGRYRGSVVLIVNVASKCGLTKQYEGLEALYREYRDRGLVVLGFPANDFAGQEPGTNEEIETFCRSTFGVEFPMYEKITVTGEGAHPLYRTLTQAQPKAVAPAGSDFRSKLKSFLGFEPNADPELLWNFEKFLVSREGEVVARFSPEMLPGDRLIVNAIEAELAKG